jgi:hypothetical protein
VEDGRLKNDSMLRRRAGRGQSKSGSMKVSFLVPDWSKFVFFDVFVDEKSNDSISSEWKARCFSIS